MSNFYILAKTLFKNSFTPLKTSKKSYKKYIILLAFLPMMIGIYSLIQKIYDVFANIKQEAIIIGIGLSVVSMAVFYFGIFYMISVFYYSSDIDNLLFLPFRPFEILGSKFTIALVYEYITEAIIFLPVIISFGVSSNANILYYLYSAIVFATLPIIPLILAGIITMIVMRFTNIFKNKDKFRVVGGILSIGIAIGLNFFIQKISRDQLSPDQIIEMFSQGNNSLLRLTSRLFPSIQFAVQSMINSENINGLLYLISFFLINVIFILIFVFVGEKIYLKGVLGISQTTTKKVKLNSDILSKYSKKHSSIFAYTLKELKIIFRTPAYFMNCVITNFLWPLFFIIPFMLDNKLIDNINKITILIKNYDYLAIIIAGSFSVGVFMSSTNSITSTSISREGKNFYVNKFLAIHFKTQIISKILAGITLSVIGSFIILLVISIILKLSFLHIILSIIFILLGIILGAMIGIIFDLISPKLVWDNEQKAVKQNLNVLFHTVIGFVLAYTSLFIAVKFTFSILQALLIMGIGNIILIGIFYYFLSTKGVKMYEKIEV